MRAKALLPGLALVLLSLAATGEPAGATAAPGAYTLGPQDKLKVEVYEWRKSVGELHQWTALSGKFLVGPDGELSLPLVGAIPAAGLTTAQLAQEISERLQKQVGLSAPANTSVEVIRYRPFYILGSVGKPGAYPFRPGLNVVEAVSIAGGLFRPDVESYEALARDSISARGSLRDLRAHIESLLGRVARFKAEAAGRTMIDFPQALLARKNDPAVAQILHNEQALFEARRQSLGLQTAAFTQLKGILEKEVVELQKKAANQDREINLMNSEVSKYSTLLKKGLGVSSRELQLQEDAASIASQRLDINNSLLRAQEAIAQANENLIDLNQKWRQEVLLQLQQTQSKLARLRAQAQTAKELIANSEITGPELVENESRIKPIYTIMRREGGHLRKIAASASTIVDPGDTIEVTRKPPRIAIGEGATVAQQAAASPESGPSSPAAAVPVPRQVASAPALPAPKQAQPATDPSARQAATAHPAGAGPAPTAAAPVRPAPASAPRAAAQTRPAAPAPGRPAAAAPTRRRLERTDMAGRVSVPLPPEKPIFRMLRYPR